KVPKASYNVYFLRHFHVAVADNPSEPSLYGAVGTERFLKKTHIYHLAGQKNFKKISLIGEFSQLRRYFSGYTPIERVFCHYFEMACNNEIDSFK
ncbi:hypothetical protein, partial [Bacillus cereus group sp. Bc007]|uniref:hypothetical protein n=1 Tax=Bacillus cereus group sp. Bc007 TaxID=3018128 RepID=UPI0022E6C7BE